MRANYYREGPLRRDPEEITELLGAIIERVGTGAERSAAILVEQWDEIVPERWKKGSQPVGIRRGVLLVEVASGADATLLRHDTAELVDRIARRLGPGVVDAVRLRVLPAEAMRKTP